MDKETFIISYLSADEQTQRDVSAILRQLPVEERIEPFEIPFVPIAVAHQYLAVNLLERSDIC